MEKIGTHYCCRNYNRDRDHYWRGCWIKEERLEQLVCNFLCAPGITLISRPKQQPNAASKANCCCCSIQLCPLSTWRNPNKHRFPFPFRHALKLPCRLLQYDNLPGHS